MASIVGENMNPFLEKIIKSMLNSVESTEGLIVSTKIQVVTSLFRFPFIIFCSSSFHNLLQQAHFTDEDGAESNLPNFAFLESSQNNSQSSVIDIENEDDDDDAAEGR